MSTHLIALLAIGFYAGAGVSQYHQIRHQQQKLALILPLTLLAFVAHLAYTALVVFGEDGINLGFFQSSTLIFCLITAVTLVSIGRHTSMRPLSLVFYPLAALSIALSSWIPSSYTPKVWSHGLSAHIILSISAYGILTIAALQAVSIALLERALKNRQARSLMQYLPPLQTMELVLFELLGFGVVLLTLAIGTGYVFLDDLFAQHVAHKTLFSLLAWGIFVVLLWGRKQYGWRGKTAVKLTLGGFFILMLAFFGSKFVLELILGRA